MNRIKAALKYVIYVRFSYVSSPILGPILTKSNMDPNPPAQVKEIDPSKLAVLSETFSRYDQDDLPDMQVRAR